MQLSRCTRNQKQLQQLDENNDINTLEKRIGKLSQQFEQEKEDYKKEIDQKQKAIEEKENFNQKI